MADLFEILFQWPYLLVAGDGPARHRVGTLVFWIGLAISAGAFVALIVGAFFFGPWEQLSDLGRPVFALALVSFCALFVLHIVASLIANASDRRRGR